MQGHHLEGSSYGIVGIGTYDPVDHQTVALSNTTNRSTQLQAGEVYRLWASVDCFVKLGGASVVAATTDVPVSAKVNEYISVAQGENYVAALVSTGTGVLYITRVK